MAVGAGVQEEDQHHALAAMGRELEALLRVEDLRGEVRRHRAARAVVGGLREAQRAAQGGLHGVLLGVADQSGHAELDVALGVGDLGNLAPGQGGQVFQYGVEGGNK